MKIKVPKTIKIATHSYPVSYNKDLRCDEGFVGKVKHRVPGIEIEPDQAFSQKNQTLLHEVLHIISRTYSCDLDEGNIDRIAEGFSELLFNNLGIELDWSEITPPKT